MAHQLKAPVVVAKNPHSFPHHEAHITCNYSSRASGALSVPPWAAAFTCIYIDTWTHGHTQTHRHIDTYIHIETHTGTATHRHT